jgi:hypothetical protein
MPDTLWESEELIIQGLVEPEPKGKTFMVYNTSFPTDSSTVTELQPWEKLVLSLRTPPISPELIDLGLRTQAPPEKLGAQSKGYQFL